MRQALALIYHKLGDDPESFALATKLAELEPDLLRLAAKEPKVDYSGPSGK